jgi:adenylyltransferase/sulfurtransferase
MKKEMGVLGVVVVGAGALGNEVAWNLRELGAERVLVVDPDVVEMTNLGLARMFTPAMVGRPKASSLAGEGRFEWQAFDGEIADLGWGRIEDRDLIFSCVDRDSARLEVARIGTRLGIPVCDGGLGVRGRVSYFPSRLETACFCCRLTAARRRELLSTWRSAAFPCVMPSAETSRVSTVDQVRATGALQVKIGLRGGDAITTEIRPGGTASFAMTVNEGCPFHGRQEPVQAFPKPFQPGMRVSWEWPICTRAHCQDCEREWSPMVRRGRLRVCPHCESDKILALECVDRIDSASVQPHHIGLPVDHRYTVRVTGSERT